MYRLEISGKVKKFIAKRTPKEQLAIIKAFEVLQQNPFHNSLDIKPFQSTQTGTSANHRQMQNSL